MDGNVDFNAQAITEHEIRQPLYQCNYHPARELPNIPQEDNYDLRALSYPKKIERTLSMLVFNSMAAMQKSIVCAESIGIVSYAHMIIRYTICIGDMPGSISFGLSVE